MYRDSNRLFFQQTWLLWSSVWCFIGVLCKEQSVTSLAVIWSLMAIRTFSSPGSLKVIYIIHFNITIGINYLLY